VRLDIRGAERLIKSGMKVSSKRLYFDQEIFILVEYVKVIFKYRLRRSAGIFEIFNSLKIIKDS
jgi:hypothetical protein